MEKRIIASALFAILGCGSAYGERERAPAPPPHHGVAVALAPTEVRAPYDVTLVSDTGDVLSTYAHKGRYYVMGDAGDRYIIRVKNPTARRVEAVITVDGLDVVDGEPGDLNKRGYIVPPYGELNVEGFRTSEANVATFRFSSVGDSYAGKKGKARNVGVIAVALFEEVPPPPPTEIIVDGPRAGISGGTYGDTGMDDKYDYRRDMAPPSPTTSSSEAAPSGGSSSKGYAGAPSNSGGRSKRAEAQADQEAPSSRAPVRRPAPPSDERIDSDYVGGGERCCAPEPKKSDRPGLGTEFGESRTSYVSYTAFVRNGKRPVAIAELRYNNAPGLTALGIAVDPLPGSEEIMLRETADPFPGDGRFAMPPR